MRKLRLRGVKCHCQPHRAKYVGKPQFKGSAVPITQNEHILETQGIARSLQLPILDCMPEIWSRSQVLSPPKNKKQRKRRWIC